MKGGVGEAKLLGERGSEGVQNLSFKVDIVRYKICFPSKHFIGLAELDGIS